MISNPLILDIISNPRILKVKIFSGFVKIQILDFFKASKQGIWILITPIQIHMPKSCHPTLVFVFY